jgi:hypothetical protein
MSKSLKNQVWYQIAHKVHINLIKNLYIQVLDLDQVGAQVGDEVLVCDLVVDKVYNQVRKIKEHE